MHSLLDQIYTANAVFDYTVHEQILTPGVAIILSETFSQTSVRGFVLQCVCVNPFGFDTHILFTVFAHEHINHPEL